MTLTIAIPTYNKEHYIERCINSALAQRPYVTEILVVDNNSTDHTWELVKKYGGAVKAVRNETNVGMAGNWNRCIELCNTELLMILHADDELLPGVIKEYLNFFSLHPDVAFLHSDFYYVRGDDNSSKWLQRVDYKDIRKAGVEFLGMGGNACSTVMVKKSAYEKLGGFMESLSSDVEMWFRIGANFDTGHLNIPTAIIHLYGDSTGGSSLTKRSLEEIRRDVTQLSDRIASWYPASAQDFLKQSKEQGLTDTFIMVFAKNLKVGNYAKAYKALYEIVFKRRGLWLLVKRGFGMVRYRITLILYKIKGFSVKLAKK